MNSNYSASYTYFLFRVKAFCAYYFNDCLKKWRERERYRERELSSEDWSAFMYDSALFTSNYINTKYVDMVDRRG